jgi:hypothetical protein
MPNPWLNEHKSTAVMNYFLFIPRLWLGIKYWYPPTHVETQNTFWLPWFILIKICLRVQIRYYTLIGRISRFADNFTHNLCCQIRADDNSSTCTFTTEKSVICTGACANEIIPSRWIARLFTKRKKDIMLEFKLDLLSSSPLF